MADTVTFQVMTLTGGEQKEFAFITHDDGSQTSMTKADYDAQQAQANPAPTAQ